MTQTGERRGHRPRLQADYGVPPTLEGTLVWGYVRQRLASARNYWVVTVDPDGAPQATPVWAAWVEDTLYFSCGRETRKAQNLARNPRIAVHLESGDDVVIMRGFAQELADRTFEPRLIAAFREKYGETAIPDSAEALNGAFYAVRPKTVLAWSEFPTDVTRWDIGEADGA